MLWFIGKVVIGIFVFVWLRGTLPRLRYDQFMAFGWKVLIPINLVWILAVTRSGCCGPRLAGLGGDRGPARLIVLLVVVVPALMVWEGSRGAAGRRARRGGRGRARR